MSFVFHFMNDTHFLVRVCHNTDIYIVNIGLGTMVSNATFNDISVISRRSFFFVEETRVPRENHLSATNHRHTLSHNVVSSTPRHERGSNSQL
jgi:hypothetical protein